MGYNIIITGLAGSGKSILAKKLKKITGEGEIITCDNFRYKKGQGWIKKNLKEYKNSILNEVNKNDNLKILEGSYYDGSDPEHMRMIVFQDLLYKCQYVFIIQPIDKVDQIAKLIDRSINRVIGKEPHGTCEETSTSRARLIIKNVENYERNCKCLYDFFEFCTETHLKVCMGTPEEIYNFYKSCKIHESHKNNKKEVNFNGGKLYHIFPLHPKENSYKMEYKDNVTESHKKEALLYGEKMLKVDGSCCALHKEDDKWVFYERRDNYKGKGKTLPQESSLQESKYKGHEYSWLKLDPDTTVGKGKRKNYPGPDTYTAIEKGVELGLIPNPKDENSPKWITCEWVGIKHQRNCDGIPYNHAIILHNSKFLPFIEMTSLDDFNNLIKKECLEGVVVSHSDGTRYKIRSDMTGLENKWEELIKSKKPIDEKTITTILLKKIKNKLIIK